MRQGWSVNLSAVGYDFEAAWPVPPLFNTSQGPVFEVVAWSLPRQCWIHLVSQRFPRQLPPGHFEVTPGEL
jgi:hypothetical protein